MNPFQPSFDRQKAYFETSVTKSYAWRIEQLDRMSALLRENKDALMEAVGQDFKTASQEKVFEVEAPLATIMFTKAELEEWMKPTPAPVPKALAASGHTASVIHEPYGVTLVIGPFNGPLILLLHPAIAALSAGNTCILKVSEAIPATSRLLVDLIARYFEPEAVTAVTGSRAEMTELLKLPFDFIFFTGSVAVGKVIMRAAAENLTPVLLELGGQNPAIVDATANIEDAARKILWGATAWGGQWCTSPGYAYVHSSIADPFADACVKAVSDFYGADPKSNTDYSRIISPAAVTRLAGLVDPTKVISGGTWDAESRYFDPTILYPTQWSDPIMRDEIFGPLLPILTFDTLDEAFAEIEKRPRPLSAFFFSRDETAVEHFLRSVNFGGGAINQTNIHLFVESIPFGGVGASGIGHYYGKYGFDALTHDKSILKSPPDVAIEHLLPPYTREKVEALAIWFDY